jgi:hypothetical protein
MRNRILQLVSNEPGDEKMQSAAAIPLRACPACETGDLRRIKRKGWLARIPFSKYYSCSKCRANFLRIFDSFHLRVKGAVGSKKTKRELAIITFAIFMTIYFCYRIVIHLYETGME